MVNQWLGVAIILLVIAGEVVAAERLGLLRARVPVWSACLYFALAGAVLVQCVDFVVYGFAHAPVLASLLTVALGAVAGALIGVLMSVFARQEPG